MLGSAPGEWVTGAEVTCAVQGDLMELFDRSGPAPLKHRIAADAQRQVEAVLARAAEYADLPEQTYLVGATALPLLLAGHHQVAQRLGLTKADDWLREHLRALGTMLSDATTRIVTITVTLTPKS